MSSACGGLAKLSLDVTDAIVGSGRSEDLLLPRLETHGRILVPGLRGAVNDVRVEQQDFRLLTLTEVELDPNMRGRVTPDLDDSAVDLIESPRDDNSVSDVQGLALLYHGAAPVRTRR